MSIPAEIWSNGAASRYTYRPYTNIFSAPLRLAFYHAKIYTNEVGLHSTHIIGADMLSDITLTTRSWYQSSERSETLIQCLQATKEYLDQFLALSPETIAHITTPAFLHLIYAVLVLGSLATTTQSPRLDATSIRSLADFESYISALSRKSKQTIATPNIGRGTHEHMSNLHHLWQQSKPWYAQSITGNGALARTIGSFPDLSFMDILSTIVQRCSSSPMLCDGSPVRCEWCDYSPCSPKTYAPWRTLLGRTRPTVGRTRRWKRWNDRILRQYSYFIGLSASEMIPDLRNNTYVFKFDDNAVHFIHRVPICWYWYLYLPYPRINGEFYSLFASLYSSGLYLCLSNPPPNSVDRGSIHAAQPPVSGKWGSGGCGFQR